MGRWLIDEGDNGERAVTTEELMQMENIALEFDGFYPWRVVSRLPITDRDLRRSDYVCFECGVKYLTKQQKQNLMVLSSHIAECGLCMKINSVYHIRHYNHLQKPKEDDSR